MIGDSCQFKFYLSCTKTVPECNEFNFGDLALSEKQIPKLLETLKMDNREWSCRNGVSCAVEDMIVETELLESARNAGYATKVIFISTEDPNLNVGRILIRMSHGGQSVPLNAVPESFDESMKSLSQARKHADDLLANLAGAVP